MKTKSKLYTVAMVAIVLMANLSCKKDINPVVPAKTPVVSEIPIGNYPSGFGSTPGKPVCKPFVLPASIELTGVIQSGAFKSGVIDKEAQNAFNYIPHTKDNFIDLGAGYYVQVFIKFHNKSNLPVSLIIPAGLLFCPGDSTMQTGTTVQNDTVLINANQTIGCNINAYCTNAQKHMPSNTNYSMPGITLHSDLRFVIDLLKSKKKISDGPKIQGIIWDITDHGGITPADIAYLNSLP